NRLIAMTYLTRCRRTALQCMRTVPPIVANKRLQHLQRLMQIRRSPSKYPGLELLVFASGDLSKDRKSSETSARNRVKIDSGGPIFSQWGSSHSPKREPRPSPR